MTLRKDHNVIKDIHFRYGATTANQIQNLPFFHITKEIENKFTSPMFLNSEGQQRQLPEYVVGIEEKEEIETLLPFKKFAMWIADLGYFIIEYTQPDNTTEYDWVILNAIDPHTAKLLNKQLNGHGSDLYDHTKGILLHSKIKLGNVNSNNKLLGTLVFGLVPTDDKKLNDHFAQSLSELNSDSELLASQAKGFAAIIEFILSYFKWAECENQFLMTRQTKPTKSDIKSAKKKPWLRTDVPHYIYLNQFPSDHHKSSSTGGDGSSKRGHNRRAHWRYLKSDRYTHAQGKRIRIKESWVGPTETTYHNSTYTVLLEGNNYEP